MFDYGITDPNNQQQFITKGVGSDITMDKDVFHRLQLEILNAIDVILLTAMYGICWYTYYGDAIAVPFYDMGNEVMMALFCAIYYSNFPLAKYHSTTIQTDI